jgi:hypothetical protein
VKLLLLFSFPLFQVVDKWKDYEKTMENFHKASVHELNNAFISITFMEM